MSDIKLSLEKRTATGKKARAIRTDGLIPSVVYGGDGAPVLAQSAYNDTEKALRSAGYHSTLDLEIDGKKSMAIVKNIDIDPVSRQIINVEFQTVSADKPVEATTPIVLIGFDESEAAKFHYEINQSIEEIDIKAKPADLPKEIEIDASKLAALDDKLTIADLILPKGVELADKELSSEQVVAALYDPAAEAAAREAKEAAEAAEATEGSAEESTETPAEGADKPAEGEKAEENKEA